VGRFRHDVGDTLDENDPAQALASFLDLLQQATPQQPRFSLQNIALIEERLSKNADKPRRLCGTEIGIFRGFQ
jgi:hypothetical protein